MCLSLPALPIFMPPVLSLSLSLFLFLSEAVCRAVEPMLAHLAQFYDISREVPVPHFPHAADVP